VSWLQAIACSQDTTPAYTHLTTNLQETKNETTNVVINIIVSELLMMGIVVPETCWACKKYKKIISGIYLVFILQFWQGVNVDVAWSNYGLLSAQFIASNGRMTVKTRVKTSAEGRDFGLSKITYWGLLGGGVAVPGSKFESRIFRTWNPDGGGGGWF